MRRLHLITSLILILSLTGCQQAIPDPASRDKLLLCAGNPDPDELAKDAPRDENGDVQPGFTYAEDNKDWYTIDSDPIMKPDLLADLTTDETLKKLSQHPYEIIIDEYCNPTVSDKFRHDGARLLKSGGILVSKVCAPYAEIKHIKKEMLNSGYSEVIFGNDSVFFTYDQKKLEPQQLVNQFRQNELKAPSHNVCFKGQWYPFVAVK